MKYQFDKELVLPAKVDELDALLDWVGGILEDGECPGKICNQIAVVCEELFVNIANYAYADKRAGEAGVGEAVVRLFFDGEVLAMQFEDRGMAFNPLEHEMPDTTAGIENRQIGGLGIYLTVKWMDSVEYERKDDKNILTIAKKLAK